MKRPVHVVPLEPRRVEGTLEIAADLEWPLGFHTWKKGRRQRVWIRVPEDLPVSAPAVADAFLLGTLFGASRLAGALCLHARATRELAENLDRLQALWVKRRPDKYHRISIECDGLDPGVPATGPSILTYSGGLDSSYSLFRATKTPSSDEDAAAPVGSAVMVHGADVPVEEVDAFEVAFARSKRMTDSRRVPLVRVVTNLRIVKQNWTHSSNTALAAILGLFRSRFSCGRIAVGFTPEEARAWWPQDLTDPPLLSSPAFPILGDGYEADRFEKMAAVAAWPEALESLRVCYRPGSWTGNCGDCFKCRVVGLFAWLACGRTPPFLPREMTIDDVNAAASCGDDNVLLRLSQLVEHARRLGVREPWILEAERAVAGAHERAP